ncbi:hypothetical protein [Brachybacterium paraconglomeratum]|nr:hypothetical protein [Brachybacterium paraconglomeratum]
MTTNTQNWRRLANTRQWIINNLSRKIKALETENDDLRRRLGEDT